MLCDICLPHYAARATLAYQRLHLRRLQRGRMLRRLCTQGGLHAASVNAIATHITVLIARRAAVEQEVGSTPQMLGAKCSVGAHRTSYIEKSTLIIIAQSF